MFSRGFFANDTSHSNFITRQNLASIYLRKKRGRRSGRRLPKNLLCPLPNLAAAAPFSDFKGNDAIPPTKYIILLLVIHCPCSCSKR
jgi:hypothetical protein